MAESIYNYVYLFNTYKSDYEDLKRDSSSALPYSCPSIDDKYSNVDENNCKYSMKYLKKIEEKIGTDYLVGGCKYLNYKLCDIVEDKRYKYDSLTHFENLRTENKSYFDKDDICDGHIQNLSEEVIKKVENLIELYKTFDNIKSDSTLNEDINCGKAKECAVSYMSFEETCKSQDDQEFCNELEIFRGRYNNLMSSVGNCTEVETFLPSFRSNKFSPFSSWLRNKIWRKMTMLDNIAQPNNRLLHNDDDAMKNPIKKIYNISYHSELNS